MVSIKRTDSKFQRFRVYKYKFIFSNGKKPKFYNFYRILKKIKNTTSRYSALHKSIL